MEGFNAQQFKQGTSLGKEKSPEHQIERKVRNHTEGRRHSSAVFWARFVDYAYKRMTSVRHGPWAFHLVSCFV